MENGLKGFYESFGKFLFWIRKRKFVKEDDEESVQALTMQHLEIPLIGFFIFLGTSLIVFLIEIMVYQFKKRRQQHLVV